MDWRKGRTVFDLFASPPAETSGGWAAKSNLLRPAHLDSERARLPSCFVLLFVASMAGCLLASLAADYLRTTTGPNGALPPSDYATVEIIVTQFLAWLSPHAPTTQHKGRDWGQRSTVHKVFVACRTHATGRWPIRCGSCPYFPDGACWGLHCATIHAYSNQRYMVTAHNGSG